MKKSAVLMTTLACLVFCAVPCFAEINVQWPPPTYDMPRTVFTSDMLSSLAKSLKLSLGAISSTGLRILGITISLSLISGIFIRLLLDKLNLYNSVWKREFHRRVKAEDRRRHLDSIVDDKVADMEINMLAKARFRLRNPLADLNEKIYQRELSFQAEQAIRERYPERALEESIYRREVSAAAGIEFTRRNQVLAAESKVVNRETSFTAEGLFRYRNPNYVKLRKVDDRYLTDEADRQYREQWPERYDQRRQMYEELARDYDERRGRRSRRRRR